jgi:hypothetical protein
VNFHINHSEETMSPIDAIDSAIPTRRVIHRPVRGRLPPAGRRAFADGGRAALAQSPWTPEPYELAFSGIIDLVRSTASRDHGEICEECKTLNRAHACYCKTCARRLPAYYASANAQAELARRRRHEQADARALAWSFAAAWLALGSLVLITAFIPVG